MKNYDSIKTLSEIASMLRDNSGAVSNYYPQVAPALNTLSAGLHSLAAKLYHESILNKIDLNTTIKKLVEMQTGGLRIELPDFFKDQIEMQPVRLSSKINTKNVLDYLSKNNPDVYSDLLEVEKFQVKVDEGVEDTFIELEERDGDYYIRVSWDSNLMNLVIKNFDLDHVHVVAGEWIDDDIIIKMGTKVNHLIGETIVRYVMGDDYIHYVDKSCIEERLDEIRFDMEHPLRDKLLTADGLGTVFCKGLTSRTLMYEDEIPLLFLNKERFDDNERPFSIGRLDGILSDNPLANSDIIDDVVHILDFILYEVK